MSIVYSPEAVSVLPLHASPSLDMFPLFPFAFGVAPKLDDMHSYIACSTAGVGGCSVLHVEEHPCSILIFHNLT